MARGHTFRHSFHEYRRPAEVIHPILDYNFNKRRNWEITSFLVDGVVHDVILCWSTARVGKSVLGHDVYARCSYNLYRSRDLEGYNLATRQPVKVGRWICPIWIGYGRKWRQPPGVMVVIYHERHYTFDKSESVNRKTKKIRAKEKTRSRKRERKLEAKRAIRETDFTLR